MNPLPKNKRDLDTPCLILDIDLLDTNIRSMQTAIKKSGKNLRPHAKTHKCSALAKKQIEAGAVGVCVAKLSEARALVNAGIENILITGPVVSEAKIARLADLATVSPSMTAVVDHPDNAAMLSQAMAARNKILDVLIDLDVGLNRTGVTPSRALALAETVCSLSGLRLRGIQAYAGQVQHMGSYEERKKASLECLRDAVPVFVDLQSRVPTCDVFSASGTGTFDIDTAIPELTELQVGSYVLMDAEYLAIGSSGSSRRFIDFEPALRILTTVVSANHNTFVTVDAGLKTLYRDGGVPQVMGSEAAGLTYDWFGDEYGRITAGPGTRLPELGSVLELITSHCDPTVNLFDTLVLTRGEDVVGSWPIDLRGCSR